MLEFAICLACSLNEPSTGILHQTRDLSLDLKSPNIFLFGNTRRNSADFEKYKTGLSSTKDRIRIIPRWAEILMIALGSSSASIGGMLLTIHDKCPGDVDTKDPLCSHIYQTKVAGISGLSLGSGIFSTGVFFLIFDEIRLNRQKKSLKQLR